MIASQALKALSARPVVALSTLALALTLSACSILPKREPNTIYEPARVAAGTPANWPQVSWSLVVARPIADAMHDSDRINVRPAPGALQVYKGASWSDSAPNLLQTTLLRRFEDSQKILSVSRPGGGLRGEFQLLTEIRSFEAVYGQAGQPQAVIEIYAKLVRGSNGEVIAARTFREAEPAGDVAVGPVVDAFSRALQRVTDQMVGWTLVTGNQRGDR